MAKSTSNRKSTPAKADGETAFDHLKDVGSRSNDAGVWVREDGSVCFGNECVVISKHASGELDFEVDPSACGVETGQVVLSYLIENLAKREPINIKVKPQEKGK